MQGLKNAYEKHSIIVIGPSGRDVEILKAETGEYEEAFVLHPDTARKLNISFSGDTVDIHVVISEDAIAETKQPKESLYKQAVLPSLTWEKIVTYAINGDTIPLTNTDRIILGFKP